MRLIPSAWHRKEGFPPAELEAALEAYMDTNNVAFLMTPCTSVPPANHMSGERSFDNLEAAAAAAKESGNFGARMKVVKMAY